MLDLIMSRNKEDQSLNPDAFGVLNKDVACVIIDHSSVRDILNLIRVSKTTYTLFRPSLTLTLAHKAQVCAVQGNPDGLVLIAKQKPEALFEKLFRTTDLYGRIFYSISAYQLIIFLCDEDMKEKVEPFIPEWLNPIRQAQYAEIVSGGGGADLIKLDFDPLEGNQDFNKILSFKTTYTLSDGTCKEVTSPLLENQDGVICYNNQFYYANRKTKSIALLEFCASLEKDTQAFEAFKTSFDAMENNSGRRSSNAEHQLITTTLKCTLHRKGIEYEENGISYCDTRTSFQLINEYRKFIRLYNEAEHQDALQHWCSCVRKAQVKEIWLLQRICEKDRPFYPLPANFDKFKRGVLVFDHGRSFENPVFVNSKLVVDSLGSDGAIFKFKGKFAGRGYPGYDATGGADAVMADLVAVCQLVESAKENVIDKHEENSLTDASKPFSPWGEGGA